MTSTMTKFAHLQIPLEDILTTTDNFSDKNIIGKGGFGNVYKGHRVHNRWVKEIAARRLNRKHGQGDVEFWKEISVLSGLNHINIVCMIGFCDEKGEKIIVNQRYAKGSLYMHLTDPALTWLNRWKICDGVAKAIEYIHEMKGQSSYYIIHRNINSSTILLSDNWVPKLSGFEFSIKQSFDRKNHVFLSEAIGTQGYLDPSIVKNGGVTHKSDIYSLGVVLFEIICGRKAYEDGTLLASLAKYHYEKGTLQDIINPVLRNQMDPESLRFFSEVAKIAYSCLKKDQALRPSAIQVSVKLTEAHKLLFSYGDQYEDHTNDAWEEKDEDDDDDDEDEKKKVEEEEKGDFGVSTVSSYPWKVKKLELKDIQLATNNFSGTFRIDSYLFGVYKAELRCFDREYLSFIKGKNKDELFKRDYIVRISRFPSKAVFDTELQCLSRCKHHNIESLLGFCEEGQQNILVYEYVSVKYLSAYLDSRILTWEKRLKICIDVAHGLGYLHDEIKDQTMVIHHNIRCDNILLDNYWRAKITGFTDSELLHPNQNDDTLHLGIPNCVVTYPLMETEYARTVKWKKELDVTNFGVVMLEILCGSNAYSQIFHNGEWKEGMIKKQIAPTIMEENSDKGPNKDSLDTFTKIACRCLTEKEYQRPTMNVVIKELEKALAFQENSKDTFRMSLQDIKIATRDFSSANQIGGGGFGRVYKGEIEQGQDNECYTIVAKKLDTSHGQGEKQFYTELEILKVYKHENVINLVGYSKETDEKIIVYEHASKGSLDKYLTCASLTWTNRLKICIDVATGLDFLHGGVKGQVVIHRDIKAANILLFDDWKAKLGDFGLSLISAINKETDYVIDHPCGTKGYVDPMYLKSGFLTLESDIYSFGVVLFEILSGRATYAIPKHERLSLLSFIKNNFEEGNQEEMVFKAIKEEIVPKSLTTFLNIIYKCLDDDRENRPTSTEVLAQLKKALEFQMFPFKQEKKFKQCCTIL